MACELSEDVNTIISQEIDDWLNINSDGTLVLLEISGDDVDCCSVNLLLGSEHEVKLHVPKGYPKHEDSFLVESEAVIQTWTIAINEYLLDSKDRLRLADVLDKAVELFSDRKKKKESSSEEEEIDEDEEEPANNSLDLDDDDTFTTAWDLKVARKKMRWSKKEPLYREIMKRRKLEQGYEVNKTNHQIFTSNAASGILTNDLIKIMECEETCGFSAEPIDDNIYHWRVRLRKFDPKSDLAHDLEEIMRRHGYNYIEMEMMFEIDLFPFYPPLVKVLRPRLQGCMMQRITNIEFLQLSYWSPTKDMKSVIEGIQDFMQRWAQIDVEHDRNDLSRLPYLDIEHYLLTLAQVSEVSPRADDKYTLDEDKIQELKTQAKVQCNTVKTDKKKDEFWARGVGYGNHNRPDWDVNAYLAAKKEKDNKIESALREILSELKKLPTTVSLTSAQLQADRDCAGTSSVSDTQAGGDYTTDMFTVLEGSALVPFMEVHLKENTFLEISRHSAVYSVIISVIREIAYRHDLLTLLCCLEGQTKSLYQHLEQLNEVAFVMLKQITKPANGHVPPDDAGRYDDDDDDEYDSDSMDMVGCLGSTLNISRGARQVAHDLMHEHLPSTEEKLAREICVLFKLVKHTLEKEDLLRRCKSEQTSDNGEAAAAEGLSNKQYSLKTCVVTETGYREAMKKLQFQSCSIPVKGKHCHYYANQGAKCPLTTSKNQVVRIAQELSSLSTSLPLNLSSSIFVRTDDEMIPLMQALITGPEGTPYSSGCFLFDVYFPPTYPLTPPKVHLRTTGEGTVRFNPNLYNCGTVCLSLLGTWQGHGGEQWNDKTSTILQVLVSIQSLILVPDPYFNEPGYEQHMNTEEGRKHSEGYNRDIRINCINHAMIGPLQNPPPGFEEVIRSHFYLKKEHILQEVQGWSRSSKCSSLDSAISSLKKELKKLTLHPKA